MAATRPFWTNTSVLALSGERDPVEAIVERARSLVFEAVEQGWQGPPYDPFELAALMRVPITPREDLYDARIVPAQGGRVRIEFNPTRPRGRVRFTIAHELAHTFFPDYAATVRHRSGPEPASPDEWQLELLCDIAAAELLMPIGSFTSLEDEPLKIEHLMELRKSFDVSSEALLLRVTKLTGRPSAVFAAARTDGNRVDSAFRLDYVVGSRSWTPLLRRGQRIPNSSVLSECTAVGYTAKARETWSDDVGEMCVECVGVPAYPGQRLPRVVGLLLADVGDSSQHEIVELVGDATEPRGEGPRIIVHLVNDKTPNWGGPFARSVKARWPEAQSAYVEWARKGERLQLGEVHLVEVETGITVATMVAQKGYGPSVKPRIRYAALRGCLEQVAKIARARDASVHMPRIGTGQAGGDWTIIQELIDEAFVRHGVEVTVYTLPGTPFTMAAETQLALGA